jgi:hypothetical protein
LDFFWGGIVSFFSAGTRWAPMLGVYPKSSDDFPNTRERILNTFKYKVRAQRDWDSHCKLHKFQRVWIRLHVPLSPLL